MSERKAALARSAAIVAALLASACQNEPQEPYTFADEMADSIRRCGVGNAKTGDGVTYLRFCQYMVPDEDMSSGSLRIFYQSGLSGGIELYTTIIDRVDAERVREALANGWNKRLVPIDSPTTPGAPQ